MPWVGGPEGKKDGASTDREAEASADESDSLGLEWLYVFRGSAGLVPLLTAWMGLLFSCIGTNMHPGISVCSPVRSNKPQTNHGLVH